MKQPQKFTRRDPFPKMPFHCEENEWVPSLSAALFWFLIVSFITVLFFLV